MKFFFFGMLLLILSYEDLYAQDYDNDGVPDSIDIDDDNDGVTDLQEAICLDGNASGPSIFADEIYWFDWLAYSVIHVGCTASLTLPDGRVDSATITALSHSGGRSFNN